MNIIDQEITTPPTPPTSSDASNFRARADSFVSWLSTFTAQIASLITKINTFITEANEYLINAYNASESAIAAANFKGNWSSSTTYLVGESVYYSGITYACLLSNSNNIPSSSPDYWNSTGLKSQILNAPSNETISDDAKFAFVSGTVFKSIYKVTFSTIKNLILKKETTSASILATTTDFTSVTYTKQFAKCVKSGDLVYVDILVAWSGKTGGSGNLAVNIPGAPALGSGMSLNVVLSGITYSGIPVAVHNGDTVNIGGITYPASWVTIMQQTSNAALSPIAIPASGEIRISGFYIKG